MFNELIYNIKGCIFRVYNTLGNIWKEEIYEQALELELSSNGFKVERQKQFEVYYFQKRVGLYRIDLLIDDKIIIELKALPEIYPLHQAQLISYLKGYDKPIGILVNFASIPFYCKVFPNKLAQKTPLIDNFDFEKVKVKGKEKIEDLLLLANCILIHLGTGYFHQIYRRAFYFELKNRNIDFEIVKKIKAKYQNQVIGSKEVNFFIIGDLLLSIIAVKEINNLILSKFCNYIHHLKCKRGLIFNFNAIHLDYRYFEL